MPYARRQAGESLGPMSLQAMGGTGSQSSYAFASSFGPVSMQCGQSSAIRPFSSSRCCPYGRPDSPRQDSIKTFWKEAGFPRPRGIIFYCRYSASQLVQLLLQRDHDAGQGVLLCTLAATLADKTRNDSLRALLPWRPILLLLCFLVVEVLQ